MIKIFLLFLNVIYVFLYPSKEFTESNYNTISKQEEEWFLIPQVDGTFEWMNSTQVENEIKRLPAARANLIITYKLYTQNNLKNPDYLIPNDTDSLIESNFNPNHPTRIIIHGWQSSGNATLNTLIRNAYLECNYFNVINVDWSSLASSINYIKVKNGVDEIGRQVAKFLDFLHEYGGMKFENLYLIGHSLGAHVSGFAGKFVRKGKINTIIGLDPAGALFPRNNETQRLAANDAEYVETIHTNAGLLGISNPIGKASFYPNKGTLQPGCSFIDIACHHSRAYEYFAESIIKNNFITRKCKNYNLTEFEYNQCLQKFDNDIRMGGQPSNHGKANGVYYLETNSENPFGIGK